MVFIHVIGVRFSVVMQNKINMNPVESDLGSNALILKEKVNEIKDGILVDLGVRYGVSSYVMLYKSTENRNKVYGIDIDNQVNKLVTQNPNYTFIQSDSVIEGKEWNPELKIDMIFIDTLHIKEQVLRELKVWFPHLKNDALLVFHDTNWPEGKKDFYNGKHWGRPEEAVLEFFEINSLFEENDYFKVNHYPESWGMTFVKLKNKNKVLGNNIDWELLEKFPNI